MHLDLNCKVVEFVRFLEKQMGLMHKAYYCKGALAVADHMNLGHLMYTVHCYYSCWVV